MTMTMMIHSIRCSGGSHDVDDDDDCDGYAGDDDDVDDNDDVDDSDDDGEDNHHDQDDDGDNDNENDDNVMMALMRLLQPTPMRLKPIMIFVLRTTSRHQVRAAKHFSCAVSAPHVLLQRRREKTKKCGSENRSLTVAVCGFREPHA